MCVIKFKMAPYTCVHGCRDLLLESIAVELYNLRLILEISLWIVMRTLQSFFEASKLYLA